MADQSTAITTKDDKSLLVRAGVVVGGIVVLALVLPVVYYAFLSALGLIGLGIAAAFGIGFIKALPLLGQKWENQLLGMRKAEARANPIEQIQNNVIFKARQLEAFKSGMQAIGAQIGSLESSLKEQAKKDPDDDLSEQWAALGKMKDFYEAKKRSYAQAYQALEDYKKAVERAKFKYGFGTAAQGIAQAMNANDAKALVENMLADEAFKSVDLRFNSAFAALDTDSMELSANNKLEFGKGITIDVQAIKIPTNDAVVARR